MSNASLPPPANTWWVDTEEGVTYVKGRVLAKGMTRAEKGATDDAIVTCNDLWSLMQAKSISLLAKDHVLVSKVLNRAKRTAGNYAQLFLDDEGTDKQGRFYWAGLAAFAAKQVVDGIEFAEIKFPSLVGQARLMSRVTYYYLLKGNFWVFLEITPWMLYWRQFGSKNFFREVDCRNVSTYDPVITAQTESMPWAKGENTQLRLDLEEKMRLMEFSHLSWELNLTDEKGALAEMNQCQATDSLKKGFRQIETYELTELSAPKESKEGLAYKAAMLFLEHEQTHHLQAMVYAHPEFKFAILNNDFGRLLFNFLDAKDPELVFNAAPMITREIEVEELYPYGLTQKDVSVKMELKDGRLYNTKDRMIYVENILKSYHRLMTKGRDFDGQYRLYMIKQMQTIAAWKDA